MLPSASPPPIQPSGRAEPVGLSLRLNERITAEVLQIAPDHVVLTLEGVRVVARLTSPEQAAELTERRLAQFIVRGVGSQGLTLQIAPPGSAASPAGQTPTAEAPSGLVSNLLKQLGLATDAATLEMARSLLQRGLPVTAETIDSLRQALSGLDRWGSAEARLAAALKAAGLPVTAGTLGLASAASAPLAEALTQLEARLQNLANGKLPADLAAQVRSALEMMARFRVDWSASPDTIAAQLREAIGLLSRGVEKSLAETNSGEQPRGLLALAQLRTHLAHGPAAAQSLVADLDRFLDAARLHQLANSPETAEWLALSLPLRQAAEAQARQARLRIAHRTDRDGGGIDPGHTRLVIHVELESGEALEVDLSVVQRRIGATVTASSDELRQTAETELPALAEGLNRAGYALQTARCALARPNPPGSTLDDALGLSLFSSAPPVASPQVNLEA